MHTQAARMHDAWQRHSCGMHHSRNTRHATTPLDDAHHDTHAGKRVARMQDSPAPTPAKRTRKACRSTHALQLGGEERMHGQKKSGSTCRNAKSLPPKKLRARAARRPLRLPRNTSHSMRVVVALASL